MPLKIIHDYFGFNRQQRNGLAVLVGISMMLLLVRLTYPYFLEAPNIEVRQLPTLPISDSLNYKQGSQKASHFHENAEVFFFDPNTVSLADLQRLGLSAKTAKTWVKFRQGGFKFKTAQDLKKVFGVSQEKYETLLPYVKIEVEIKQPSVELAVTKSQKIQNGPIDLNTADSLALVSVSGIGPSYASRILKYKGLLGGYLEVAQLKEVYGFTDELYNRVASQFAVSAFPIRKLDLNKDDFKTVNRHPYISFELTKQIFDWRRKTTITAVNLRELLKDEALYAKLLPYLNLP